MPDNPPMQNILDIKNLDCAYEGRKVVSGLSLSLGSGDISCLLGPSGCGKSTILRAIAGFHEVCKGEIRVKGAIVSSATMKLPPERRKIGMVFQDYALFPHLTVAQNIGFGLHKATTLQKKHKIESLLELVNLADLAERYPHELSGGQQQRVALARALAPEPDLILLDEPFSNLDVELRKRLSLDVRDILKSQHISAILVTHDQSEAFAMCDQIGVIQHGELQQWDTPYNLYHEPCNRFVASFIGQGSFIKGTLLTHESFATELGPLSGNRSYGWPHNTQVEILLRPDDIVYRDTSCIRAQVISKTFAGTSTLYKLKLASGTRVEALFPSHQDLYVGDEIGIDVDAEHLIAFLVAKPLATSTALHP